MNYDDYEWGRDKAKGTAWVSFAPDGDATYQGADIIARSMFSPHRKVRLYARGEWQQTTPPRAYRLYVAWGTESGHK